MHIRIGCEFSYDTTFSTPMIFNIHPRPSGERHRILDEVLVTEPYTSIHRFTDTFGNDIWRIQSPMGGLRLFYDALAEVADDPDPVLTDLPGALVQDLPDDVLPFLLPSRHCQSDMVQNEAWELFGGSQPGSARVQAICDWIHANVEYASGSSQATTSGYEAYQQRKGVCRDFAHIGVMLCRAMTIPARYVYGYLPDIDCPPNPLPMDFHAWFEVWLDGAWRTFDARHNMPRIGRVLIAMGRDAVDVALTTSYGGSSLNKMTVWADEVSDDVSLDRAPENAYDSTLTT